MLLVIDIGNTNIVLGVFDADRLAHCWRLETKREKTEDEYMVLITQLFAMGGGVSNIKGCILSSVVPPMASMFAAMLERAFSIRPLVVGPGIKTGMPILAENPREVGADRIVNAVAAYSQTGDPTIVVDFGTATTFDAISRRGEYLGGAICPGVTIAADALYQRASKLPRVDIILPTAVIGRNTVAAMQVGIGWGYVALIDGLVERMSAEMGEEPSVVTTGGLGGLFVEYCERLDRFEPDLTLHGLRLLYEANRAP